MQSKPKGPHKTFTVCKSKTAATSRPSRRPSNKARAGDTIRVRDGVYREAVQISGQKKRFLRLIGNPAHPEKVLLRARGNMQNGIAVNAANEVTVDGFMARDYKSNGFFFTNLTGYTMNHLIARHTGVYGLYAFNTIGGRMMNSEAYYANDGSFYIGQTPPQTKPVRTLVSNVEGWGSPLGFSATNMRYVTITKSRFYNNAAGIVPNALDSEKFPPPEENAIVDNDIYWNNFNYHQGKPPFAVRENTTAALVPVGTGILLLGGRGHRIENNRIHGNFLTGVAAIDGILLAENPDAKSLERNVVRNNQFGQDGTDANGVDLMYDGSGKDNCFSLDGVGTTFPADQSTFAGCGGAERVQPVRPGRDARLHRRERAEGLEQAPAPRHAGLHALRGVRVKVLIAVLAGVALLSAAPAQGAARKTVTIGDNYFTSKSLTVKRGTKITWRWPGYDEAGDVHDVGLMKGPEGREEVPLRAGLDGLQLQPQADRAGDLQARLLAAPRDADDGQGPLTGTHSFPVLAGPLRPSAPIATTVTVARRTGSTSVSVAWWRFAVAVPTRCDGPRGVASPGYWRCCSPRRRAGELVAVGGRASLPGRSARDDAGAL